MTGINSSESDIKQFVLENKQIRQKQIEESFGYECATYWSPTDEDEQLRLTSSHFAAKEVFEGNVQHEVANYVSFEKGIDCLHICCGAGAFLIDMAADYPKSRFTGVDVGNLANIISQLPNVTYAMGNVVKGLNFADNNFDYIQTRMLGTVLTKAEWPVALKEIHRLLKPGGCVGNLEYETRECGSEDCRKLFRAMNRLSEKFNQVPTAGVKFKEWAQEAGLEVVATDETLIQFGPDTSRAKRWRWIWAQTCLLMGPHLSKELNVKQEDWPAYVKKYISDLEGSGSYITIIRTLARKPQ